MELAVTEMKAEEQRWTRCVAVLIEPTIVGTRYPIWWLLRLFMPLTLKHWRAMLWPHRGPCQTAECYRLIVGVNGRRLVAWRHGRLKALLVCKLWGHDWPTFIAYDAPTVRTIGVEPCRRCGQEP